MTTILQYTPVNIREVFSHSDSPNDTDELTYEWLNYNETVLSHSLKIPCQTVDINGDSLSKCPTIPRHDMFISRTKFKSLMKTFGSWLHDKIPVHSWCQYEHILCDPTSIPNEFPFEPHSEHTRGHYVYKLPNDDNEDELNQSKNIHYVWLSFALYPLGSQGHFSRCLIDSIVVFNGCTGKITSFLSMDKKDQKLVFTNYNAIKNIVRSNLEDLYDQLSSGQCSLRYGSESSSKLKFTHHTVFRRSDGTICLGHLFSELREGGCGTVAQSFEVNRGNFIHGFISPNSTSAVFHLLEFANMLKLYPKFEQKRTKGFRPVHKTNPIPK